MATKGSAAKLNLILLGDVAAGKATQSAYFSKKYKLFDFDMGRELTLLRQKDPSVHRVLIKSGDKGILSPSHIAQKILKDKIKKTPKSKGILFDGHPKMVQEAKLAVKLLNEFGRAKPLVLYITIPVAETHKRIAIRKGYIGTKMTKRPDDSLKALQNRAKYYRKNIRGVVRYFSSVYTFKKIDGMGNRDQVRARVQRAINEYLKNSK